MNEIYFLNHSDFCLLNQLVVVFIEKKILTGIDVNCKYCKYWCLRTNSAHISNKINSFIEK